jgi:hypothetical protein
MLSSTNYLFLEEDVEFIDKYWKSAGIRRAKRYHPHAIIRSSDGIANEPNS